MFAGGADVKGCFHRMMTPRWMHPFFSLSPLAQELDVVGRQLTESRKAALLHLCWWRIAGWLHSVLTPGAARRRGTFFRWQNRRRLGSMVMQRGSSLSSLRVCRQPRYHQQPTERRRCDPDRVERRVHSIEQTSPRATWKCSEWSSTWRTVCEGPTRERRHANMQFALPMQAV